MWSWGWFWGSNIGGKGCLGPWGLFLKGEMVYSGIICGLGDGFGEVIWVERAVWSRGGGFGGGNSV